MKKYSFLTLVLLVAGLTGCVKEPGENDGLKRYSLKNVSSVFVVNPTIEDKPLKQTWVDISSYSRNAVFEEEAEIEAAYVPSVRTPTFVVGNNDFPMKRAAAANEEIKIKEYKVGSKRYFQSDFDPYLKTPLLFTCVYEGEYCYIWTCNKESDSIKLNEEETKKFAAMFDKMYVKETALVGPKYDGHSVYTDVIDPNAKISLIFYDMIDVYAGFVTFGDMHKNIGSNEIEGAFLSTRSAKDPEKANFMYSALFHEMNHKLNYDNKGLKYGLDIESWYTEMLSMMVEDFFYEDLGIQRKDSPLFRLGNVVNGGSLYGFKNWDQVNHGIEAHKYSNAYTFGAYLARNYGGAKLIHEIATNEYSNEESVVKAVNKINNTKKTFQDLLNELPLVLINLDGKNNDMPTLAKGTKDVINGFEFKLNPIDNDAYHELVPDGGDLKIYSNDVDSASAYFLGAYGFQYYAFDKGSDVTLRVKKGLKVIGK